MTRTDIHRPSAINPAEYDFVAVKYIGHSAYGKAETLGARKVIGEHISRTGGKYSDHEHGGTCHVCGANALYLAVWHHRPTNTYICTGEDCADNMDLHGANFQAVREQVRRHKEFKTGKARAEQELADRTMTDAWMIYSATARDDFQFEERTVSDLVAKLVQYGRLSDKQWSFLLDLMDKIANRGKKQTARDALHAIDVATSQHVGSFGDRITIEGTIFFTTSYETAYGTTYVTGIRDAAGNVYIQKGVHIGDRDDDVRIKATVKEHSVRDGVKQTIISRPKAV